MCFQPCSAASLEVVVGPDADLKAPRPHWTPRLDGYPARTGGQDRPTSRFGSHHATLLRLREAWPTLHQELVMAIFHTSQPHEPWNKGKLIGQKAP